MVEQTDSTGLVFLRARYYAPTQGRFIQRDTWAGDYNRPHSLNGWNYTNGNPVNYTDPSGHVPCSMLPLEDQIASGCQSRNPQNPLPPTNGAIWLKGFTEAQLATFNQPQLPLEPTGCAPYAMAMALNVMYGGSLGGKQLNDSLEMLTWLDLAKDLFGPTGVVLLGFGGSRYKSPWFGTLPGEQAKALNDIAHFMDSEHPPFVATLKTGGTTQDLIDNLKNGYPTLVNISYGGNSTLLTSGVGHVMVLVGYDPPDYVFLNPLLDVNTLDRRSEVSFLQDWKQQPSILIPSGTMITIKPNP